AVLIHKAIGDNLTCIFVDHGLLRKNEGNDVERIFREKFDINLSFNRFICIFKVFFNKTIFYTIVINILKIP
ncbi:hypothetical protein ACTPEF_24100, partial [Clostridioides difficile]